MDSDRSLQELPTGAEARFSGQHGRLAVVCANGGRSAEVPGTWSASIEWLVGRLAPLFPDLRFAELRYRVKSWKRLDLCVEDALAAIEASGAERVLLMGFSMGGAVAVRAAAHPAVAGVLGLAPWLPDQLDLAPLRGRRLDVLHGALDRWLPGIPGVSPSSSRRGYERARRLGVDGSYTVIPRAVHGIALRSPWGALVTLPRAGRWAELAAAEVGRFRAGALDDGSGPTRERLERGGRPSRRRIGLSVTSCALVPVHPPVGRTAPVGAGERGVAPAAATTERTARSLLPFPDRRAILNSMVQYTTTVDRAFAALADPTRRAVLERLGDGSATISELAEPFGMSLTGMKKHIRLLEEANLVATEKVGRARRCALVPYAFEGISTWLQRLDRFAQVVQRTKGAR